MQTVYLVTDENREPITCKMLDLDTITQAKEKALDAIYMNTPITRRPNVHDVDLGKYEQQNKTQIYFVKNCVDIYIYIVLIFCMNYKVFS